MGLIEELADKLARDAIAAAEDLDDPRLIDDIARMLADTSSTTKEAFMTSVRVRLAEARARKFLEARIAKARAAAKTTPGAPEKG
ncbi:hypothetical protein [Actibacterium sp. MT2.3-13A]|uniref:hypothetical protein n=1 Tax=Actibacterium sp. MT2.3-13A TaxID=2828332 RepID=UPI001BAC4A3D|nr:hypothetical protein [Actibacterium sp. MT2.3-13A]